MSPVNSFILFISKIFVILVWILISNMVFTFYIFICYQAFQNSLLSLLSTLVVGTWLAVNTVFHYYMGWRTSPGYAPTIKFNNVVSVCKKCLTGKPPRTHHCSVCNKCVLKMDHHCPWFNNCIGHFNHRYFYLFIIFMILDCTYLCTFGFNLYQKHVYPNMDITILDLFRHSLVIPSGDHMPGYKVYHKLTTIEFFVAFVAIFALCKLKSLKLVLNLLFN
jgi:palmitoyltransferase